MRWKSIVAALTVIPFVSARSPKLRDYEKRDYYAVHLAPHTSLEEVALHLGVEHDGQLADIPNHHIFSTPKQDANVVGDAILELKRRRRKRELSEDYHILDSVLYEQKQVLRKRLVKRAPPEEPPRRRVDPGSPTALSPAVKEQQELASSLGIKDPIFNNQWHLFNTEQSGHDLNITEVWKQGITGKNTTVCIIDDGLDMDSEDLKPNYFAKGSYDFNDKVDEPKPRLSDDRHGTRCAGEVAAAKNDVCGVGVAWDSNIAGIRILSKPINDIDEAEAIIYGYQENDIYSCSWGPPDNGETMEAPGILIRKAMVQAVQRGRRGKGTIYVFAAGNGAPHDDNCNFDGYTNSIYSITVGAVNREDKHPWYSEACSALMVVTYSSGGSGSSISTTDVGVNTCTSAHGGTSAAGPLASGVFALILGIRPDLTWRDMQWLTVMTSNPPLGEPSDWQTGPLGRNYSHQFGYGKLDAFSIVELAKTWKPVKPQAWYYSDWMHVRQAIPQGNMGISSTVKITEETLAASNLERLEHVTVTMNVQHTRRGDISVELRSPSGITSHLSTSRRTDAAQSGYVDWTFMSVAHFGETGIGDWTIVVKDAVVNANQGNFTDWKLRLWGECIDPSKQGIIPLPDEHDDDDHDKETPHHVATIPVSHPTPTSKPGIPATKPDRPQRPPRPSITSTITPTPTVKPIESQATPKSPPIPALTAKPDYSDQFLPSPFPTFGVSKKTQVWIYAAIVLILVFVLSLGAYLVHARRRRRRLTNPRDAYEFEMLDDQEGIEGAKKARRTRGESQRGGALYDAFAGESDEELFSGSEDEGERGAMLGGENGGRGSGEYRDEPVGGDMSEKR